MLIKPFGHSAIVIGGVCYANTCISIGTPLHKHEAKHAEQQRNLGWLFYVQYVLWFFVKGYQDNPFEIEAREAEGE